MNRLKDLGCYLSGPIDFAENLGADWRNKITPYLEKKNVRVDLLADTKIKEFDFVSKNKQSLSTQIISDSVKIEGININTKLSIEDGEYSLDNGVNWLSSDGTIINGNNIIIRHTTSDEYSTRTKTVNRR